MEYRDRVETAWPFQIHLPVGAEVPFHCTASGKVFLANLSSSERRRIVGSLKFESKTQNTITSYEDFMRELMDVKKNAVGFDNEEFVEGMIAIAVPVYDGRGRYHASLAFHGPTSRMSLDDMLGFKDDLQLAARELTDILFD